MTLLLALLGSAALVSLLGLTALWYLAHGCRTDSASRTSSQSGTRLIQMAIFPMRTMIPSPYTLRRRTRHSRHRKRGTPAPSKTLSQLPAALKRSVSDTSLYVRTGHSHSTRSLRSAGYLPSIASTTSPSRGDAFKSSHVASAEHLPWLLHPHLMRPSNSLYTSDDDTDAWLSDEADEDVWNDP